jgi:CCR4-NOT transcription complex subunit 4
LPCSNSDCLYLHDYGSQDDSFTKDDLVSAFERSRVQQVIGATNNLHRRSGNVLPPPVFENTNTSISMAKPVARSPSNYTSDEVRGLPADNGTGRSSVPPNAASWVMRVSTSLPPVTSFSVSGGPPNQNLDISDNSQVLPSEVVGTESSTHDATKFMVDEESWGEVHSNAKLKPTESTNQFIDRNGQVAASNTNTESILDITHATVTSNKHFPHLLAAKGINQNIALQSTSTSSPELTKPSYSQTKGSQQDDKERSGEASMSTDFMEAALMEDLLGLDDQQPKDFKGIHQLPSISSSPCLLQNLNQSGCHFWQHGEVSKQSNVVLDPRIVRMKHEEVAYPLISESTVSSNGFSENKTNILPDFGGTFGPSSVFSEKGLGNVGIYEKCVPVDDNSADSDIGESSIISNILSLDIDTWEDSLTSPHGLVKLLSETGKQQASIKVPNLQKAPDKNQSRFSFARQEDFLNQVSGFENSLGSIRHVPDEYSTSRDFVEKKDLYTDTYEHIFSSGSSLETGNYPSSDPFTSSKLHVSRAPTSIPPGFSVPTKATPPGFPSHGRTGQAFDTSGLSFHIYLFIDSLFR